MTNWAKPNIICGPVADRTQHQDHEGSPAHNFFVFTLVMAYPLAYYTHNPHVYMYLVLQKVEASSNQHQILSRTALATAYTLVLV